MKKPALRTAWARLSITMASAKLASMPSSHMAAQVSTTPISQEARCPAPLRQRWEGWR